MIMRDKIKEYKKIEIPDGYGGVEESLAPSLSFMAKVSISNDVKQATAYGVLAEQVLNVVSFYELQDGPIYEYAQKKYSMRRIFKKGRNFYSTLVEVA